MSLRAVLAMVMAGLFVNATQAASNTSALARLQNVHRIIFLGDSITYAGHYVEDIEAYYTTRFPDRHFEFLNLGLPSETVSGLSEPGHAGGKFLRPDLHWRLSSILQKTKPDLVFACYGMNDGIYLPFDEERFQQFKDGMKWLHEQVVASGAKLIHVTPPTFDGVTAQALKMSRGKPASSPPYEGYNTVLDHYSDWLLAQGTNGWSVVDLHVPMNLWLAEQRKENPKFSYTHEGVHPDAAGHWVMAKQILLYLGAEDVADDNSVAAMLSGHPHGKEILKLTSEKQSLLKNAWLTYTGYKRPGIKQGLPIQEAQSKAAELDRQIEALIKPNANAKSALAFPGNKFVGVRLSPGAATFKPANGLQMLNVVSCVFVAVAGDGHTPYF